MAQRPPDGRDDEDMPWNDSPADSSAFPGHEEPDPANVVGDEDNPRDTSLRDQENLTEADTLEERLRAEVPEGTRGSRRAGMEIADGDDSDTDNYSSGDSDDDADDDLSAEEAALNLEGE
jgi:hypothetical protein